MKTKSVKDTKKVVRILPTAYAAGSNMGNIVRGTVIGDWRNGHKINTTTTSVYGS